MTRYAVAIVDEDMSVDLSIQEAPNESAALYGAMEAALRFDNVDVEKLEGIKSLHDLLADQSAVARIKEIKDVGHNK